MKTKILLIATLVGALGAGVLWLTPTTSNAADKSSTKQKILHYTCPMHPSVKEDKPGSCPICGMSLVPVYATNNVAVATNNPTATKTNTSPKMSCCATNNCH